MSTRETIQQTLGTYYPKDGRALLFGSRARGDASAGSDWDILLLLNKDGRATDEDFQQYAYPLVELGLKINEQINPIIFTIPEWEHRSFTPFYHNVNDEAVELCH